MYFLEILIDHKTALFLSLFFKENSVIWISIQTLYLYLCRSTLQQLQHQVSYRVIFPHPDLGHFSRSVLLEIFNTLEKVIFINFHTSLCWDSLIVEVYRESLGFRGLVWHCGIWIVWLLQHLMCLSESSPIDWICHSWTPVIF